MEYTIFLTGQSGALWRATVPWLPECVVEAPTRAEALEKIQQRIRAVVNQVEVLRVELSDVPKTTYKPLPTVSQTPWQWFGVFQDDPTWGLLFDDIERQRDEHLTEA